MYRKTNTDLGSAYDGSVSFPIVVEYGPLESENYPGQYCPKKAEKIH